MPEIPIFGILVVFSILGYAYYMAFPHFRKYLAIRNTPTSKVIALSPGLCEVYGRAVSDSPLTLFDGAKCVYYWMAMGGKSGHYTESAASPFYVEDETGKVLIDASGLLGHSNIATTAMSRHYLLPSHLPQKESREFFEERAIAARFPIHIRYIPVGSRIHVLGDYKAGRLPRPTFGNFTELGRFFRFDVFGSKALYPKKLPSGESHYIGLGESGVMSVSAKTEGATIEQYLLSAVLGFALCPLALAFFPVAALSAISGVFGQAPFGHPLELAIATYALLMLPPLYLYLASFYNSLITLKNNSAKYLANIGVYEKRRRELIPQLRTVVEGYAKHEKSLLENLAAKSLSQKSFAAIAEKYPKLKADEHYEKFSKSLSEAEEQIAHSRKLYNDSATLYNTRIQTFPSVMVAAVFRFSKLRLLNQD
jgi:LemA protein